MKNKFVLLNKNFATRNDLIIYVRSLSPLSEDYNVSYILGGKKAAIERLESIDITNYGKSRNYIDGKITKLSAYLRHGIINLVEVKEKAFNKVEQKWQTRKFLEQLAWRDFWQTIYRNKPETIWNSAEDYKTGFKECDYADELPNDIKSCSTNNVLINQLSSELIVNGYIHNRARLFLAAYIVHFRRIKWQAGAKWFLHHLVDGDPASNNLSWQWVASTFSNQPYIFNLDTAKIFFNDEYNLEDDNNKELNYSYDDLRKKLFPNLFK